MRLPIRHIQLDRAGEYQLRAEPWKDDFVHGYLSSASQQAGIRLRYRGGHTRHYPKKSYEVRVGTRSIHYNAEYDDPSMLRNALSFWFFEAIGVPSPRTRHVRLTINGIDQGIYLEIEGVDSAFFRKRGLTPQALLYAVNNKANFRLKDERDQPKRSLSSGYETVIGGEAELARIAQFVRKLQASNRRALPVFLQQQLHITQYLKWLAGAVFTGNYDGFNQNYALYRLKGQTRFRISPWDYEGTWGRDCYGEEVSSRLVRITGYNGLTEKLLSIPAYRRQYAALLRSILQRMFTQAKLEPLIRAKHASLLPELAADHTRRHSVRTIEQDLDVMSGYIRRRRAHLISLLDELK